MVNVLGVLALAVLPVLALLGFFGESGAEQTLSGEALELHVSYPTRLRYKRIDTVEVRVRNVSGEPIDRVVVKFDEGYIEEFSSVHFTPSISRAYEVELKDVQPDEERLVSVEIQAEEYWRHRGTVTVEAGPHTLTARIMTFTFP
jgi:hypothetical protein